MSDFNDVYVYFTDEYEVCHFTNDRVMWVVNFAIGGRLVDIWRLDAPLTKPRPVDCVRLSEDIVSVEQLRDIVHEHDGTED